MTAAKKEPSARVPARSRWVQPITIRDDAFVFYQATSAIKAAERRAYCQRIVDRLHNTGVVLSDDAARDSFGCAAIMDTHCTTELAEFHVTEEGWRLLLMLLGDPTEEPSDV